MMDGLKKRRGILFDNGAQGVSEYLAMAGFAILLAGAIYWIIRSQLSNKSTQLGGQFQW